MFILFTNEATFTEMSSLQEGNTVEAYIMFRYQNLLNGNVLVDIASRYIIEPHLMPSSLNQPIN